MLLTIPLNSLPMHTSGRGPRFIAAVLEASTGDDKEIKIESAEWHRLTCLHRIETLESGRIMLTLDATASRLAACDACDWTRRKDGRPYCDHSSRKCAKLFPARSTERCALGRWPESSTLNPTTKMNPPDFSKRLADRKTALQARVQQSSEAVTLTEARLAQAKQRLALAQGELKAVSDVIADQESVTPAVQ